MILDERGIEMKLEDLDRKDCRNEMIMAQYIEWICKDVDEFELSRNVVLVSNTFNDISKYPYVQLS